MQIDKKDSLVSQDSQSEKLQLFVSCRNLVDLDIITVTDSFLIVKMQESNKPEKQILRSKVYYNDLNPNYAESIPIQFFFEIKQRLKFEVYHHGNKPELVGRVETSVGQIFGCPDNGLIRELTNEKNQKRGKIIIRCEKVHKGVANKQNYLKIKAMNLPNIKYWYFFGGTCSFFRIIRKRKNDQLLVYQSEVVNYSNNPSWNQIRISERKLSSNDENQILQLRVFNYSANGNHTLIGTAKFTSAGIDREINYDVMANNVKVGNIVFQKVHRVIKYQLGHFLERGLQLALVTAIDFTASNKEPNDMNSLHYMSKTVKSPYQHALEQVLNILLDYDSDKLVPVYGFGAKVKMPNFDSQGMVHHCFPLNGNQHNPNIYQKQGIMQAYKEALKYLKFSGPTQFSGFLSKAIEDCRQFQKDNNQYMILFILTDGEIHDRQRVIDQIVECNNLPISIIIVGIGKSDFQLMHELDDDNCQMVDSHGKHTTRDLVQFVEFQPFKNDSIQLARQVLEELPRQVSEYFMNAGIKPQNIRGQKKLNDIEIQMHRVMELREK